MVEWVQFAERLGVDMAFAAEAWWSDAVTPLAYLADKTSRIRLGTGIMQTTARTPVMTAMTALTLHDLNGGRFVLGLGASGPQVVEGLHGVRYAKALTRLRETSRSAGWCLPERRCATRAKSSNSRFPTAKARRFASHTTPSAFPSTLRRSARTPCAIPAPPRTVGSALHSRPIAQGHISTFCVRARGMPGAATTRSILRYPYVSRLAKTSRQSSTNGTLQSHSTWAAWAPPQPTSTTMPLFVPAMLTMQRQSRRCGSMASGRPRQPCPRCDGHRIPGDWHARHGQGTSASLSRCGVTTLKLGLDSAGPIGPARYALPETVVDLVRGLDSAPTGASAN